jgi:2Fe-2S ferredoxin
MPTITYIEHSGARHEIDVEEGASLMEGALRGGVPGIAAECGGSCACGTCHVYVDPAWSARLPAKQENEGAMLEFGTDTAPTSRLACQVRITAQLDGLVVRIPETQR